MSLFSFHYFHVLINDSSYWPLKRILHLSTLQVIASIIVTTSIDMGTKQLGIGYLLYPHLHDTYTTPTRHLHYTYTTPILYLHDAYTIPTLYLSCSLYQAPSIMHPILYLHYTYTIPTRHLHYLDEILVISGMLSLKGIVERRNQLDGKGARTVPVSSADSNRNIFIYDKSSLTFTH